MNIAFLSFIRRMLIIYYINVTCFQEIKRYRPASAESELTQNITIPAELIPLGLLYFIPDSIPQTQKQKAAKCTITRFQVFDQNR